MLFLLFFLIKLLHADLESLNHDFSESIFHFPIIKKPGLRRHRRRLEGASEEAHFWDVKDHPDHSAVEGADYFYAVIQIGSPPKSFDMILDTGSHLAYIPCKSTCKTCGHNHHHQPYDKEQSSTYGKLECSDKLCSASKLSCKSGQCSFGISYMEGSSVHGTYMKEMLTLGPSTNSVEIPVAIGCIQSETKLIYGQDADGILGLGDSPVSILNQFHAYGLPLSFGICFGSDNEGVMTFGNYKPPGMKWTQMVQRGGRESYFKVKVIKVLIGGKALDVAASAYGSSTLLDTGSSDTLIPRKIFAAFQKVMAATVKGKMTKERDGNLCFRNSNTEEMYASIPELEIILDGDVHIIAPFPNLIYKKQQTYICTTVFEHYGQMIIGGNTMMDHFIYLDRENKKVGVAKSNCRALKEGLYRDAGEEVATAEEKKPTGVEDEESVESGEAETESENEDETKEDATTESMATELDNAELSKPDEMPEAKVIKPEPALKSIITDPSVQEEKIERSLEKKEAVQIQEEQWEAEDDEESTGRKWFNWKFFLFLFAVVVGIAFAMYYTPRSRYHYTLVATQDDGFSDSESTAAI